MPDIDQLKTQAEDAAETAGDHVENAAEAVGDKAEEAVDEAKDKASGLKSKLDRDGDGDTDFDDVKTMAKDAVDKVKGIFKK